MAAAAQARTVALAGNPNSGKTTLFNQLTGANHRTANYPGITVNHTFGTYKTSDGHRYTLVDLPGAYSIEAHSPEEEIAQRFILGDARGERATDLICVVVDATNLERNLYFASQLTELSIPAVVALNMMDLVREQALRIDIDQLSERLGVPVIPVVAADKTSLGTLEMAFKSAFQVGGDVLRWGRRQFRLDAEMEQAVEGLAQILALKEPELTAGEADFLARKLLGGSQTPRCKALAEVPEVAAALTSFRAAHASVDLLEQEIQARYAWIRELLGQVQVRPERAATKSRTESIDGVVLHRVAGPLILFSVFSLVFMAVFFLAAYPMDAIDAGKGWLIEAISGVIAAGELQSLITNGIIEGVGSVVVFVPQIFLLFLLVAVLEDFGYLARAAFILDRFLSKVGLSGRAFVPLLSSFACAIPGILATRTIPSKRERLLTILIAPLMVCSARLPVYSLLIGAFVVPLYGALAGALAFVGLYLLAILASGVIALIFGRTVLKGGQDPLLLELPPYKRPVWRNIWTVSWERSLDFLKNAGTIILSIAIVLWFLATHPKDDALVAQLETAEGELAAVTAVEGEAVPEQVAALETRVAEAQMALLETSYAGRIGKAMEPAIAPLGFDWKVGVGILTSFAAREVFVGTMSTIYGIAGEDADQGLAARLQNDRAADGTHRYNLLVALSLLVFYAFACQCMSTLAVVARETRGWRWPVFMFGYMSVMAYVGSLVVYQGGHLLGLA